MRTRKMRFVSALLALAMMFLLMPTAAFADNDDTDTFISGKLKYKILDDASVEVLYPTEFEAEREIPETVTNPADNKTYTVIRIADYAFCMDNRAAENANYWNISNVGRPNFIGITIPKTVTEIGVRAFAWCGVWNDLNAGIKYVRFEEGSQLKIIGKDAFAGCYGMKECDLPTSVVSIGKEAFNSCWKLERLTLSKDSKLEEIGEGAFTGLASVKEIIIPKGVTKIPQNAFANCDNLTTIEIPKTVKEIESNAFSTCPNLKEVIYDGTQEEWEALVNSDTFNASNNDKVKNPTNLIYLCDVTFDTNGHGTAPAAQQVYKGETLEPVAEPTDNNYKFGGWYTDKVCTEAFAADTPIEQSMTLYAKWDQKAAPIAPASAYKVTVENGTAWVKNGDKEEQVEFAEPGQTVTVKANDNIADGMKFDHWEIRKGTVELVNDHTAETTFTMPAEPVELAVMLTTEGDDSGWDAGTVVTTAVLGTGVAVLAYHIGMEVYADQVLGAGVPVPTLRGDVAQKAWQLAGKPEVAIEGEPLSEATIAQKWAVESGLMTNKKDGAFHPEKSMSKWKALRTLDAAKKMG